MKFPRHARIFHGQLDAAPFITVFFLLVIFVLLGSLVYTPGTRVHLPRADELAGAGRPIIPVAMDATGQIYFENQRISDSDFTNRLHALVRSSTKPLTLEVQRDQAATDESLHHLGKLARDAGVYDLLLAAHPRAATVTGDSTGGP